MDTDTCADVSHALDPILDEADPIDQSYYLKVAARPGPQADPPGALRAAQGQKIRAKLIRPNADGVRAGRHPDGRGHHRDPDTDNGPVAFEVNAASSLQLCDDEDLFD